jgi:hypothetical protein
MNVSKIGEINELCSYFPPSFLLSFSLLPWKTMWYISKREREGEECDSYGAHLFWWLVYRQAKQVGREKSMDIYDPFKKEKEKEKSSMDIMLFSRRFNEY